MNTTDTPLSNALSKHQLAHATELPAAGITHDHLRTRADALTGLIKIPTQMMPLHPRYRLLRDHDAEDSPEERLIDFVERYLPLSYPLYHWVADICELTAAFRQILDPAITLDMVERAIDGLGTELGLRTLRNRTHYLWSIFAPDEEWEYMSDEELTIHFVSFLDEDFWLKQPPLRVRWL